ncbi:MAG: MFS transporter [Bacillota bacterium]|nr:MFS transporter [Bacillota bacterium]
MNQVNTKQPKVDDRFYTKSNFGKKGWGMIIFVGILLFFCSATTNDGFNATVPAIAEENGWDYATILAYATPAGFISVITSLLFGILADKKGAKFVTTICIIGTAACYAWHGNAGSELQYFIALTGLCAFAQAAAWIGGGAYLTMWFPKKKGLALGWATMGNNLSTAIVVPIITGLMFLTGSFAVTSIIAAIVILLSVIFCFVFPNRPEDARYAPDNLPLNDEQMEAYKKEAKEYVSPWTYGKLFATKEMWLITLVLGFSMLMTVGVVSQVVVRLTSEDVGWSQPKAVTTMTVIALMGIVGSYLFGLLDQKIGAKKATAAYMVWFGVGIFLNTLPGDIFIYISLFMIGFALGGNANWPMSLTSTVFGHRNFAKAYSLILPLYTLIRCCAYIVLAFFISTTGSLTGAYIAFAIVGLIGAAICMLINDKKYTDGTLGE